MATRTTDDDPRIRPSEAIAMVAASMFYYQVPNGLDAESEAMEARLTFAIETGGPL